MRFLFITGVTKFAKTSIFSSLNNLSDLSQDERAATLCGYTKQEIEKNFPAHLEQAALGNNLSVNNFMCALTAKYNGYRFEENQHATMYAPFAVLPRCRRKSCVITGLRQRRQHFLSGIWSAGNTVGIFSSRRKIHENSLDVCEPEAIDLPVILFQTGYLTIKSYNPHTYSYTLVTPNIEVKNALSAHLFHYITRQNAAIATTAAYKFHQALEKRNLDEFIRLFKAFMAGLSYLVDRRESVFHAIFYAVTRLVKDDVSVEESTANGRMDAVIRFPGLIYIFEFKVNRSAQAALQQIFDKKILREVYAWR